MKRTTLVAVWTIIGIVAFGASPASAQDIIHDAVAHHDEGEATLYQFEFGLPVVSAVKGGLGRLNGRFSG